MKLDEELTWVTFVFISKGINEYRVSVLVEVV